jgi:ribosomal protein L5
MKEFANTSVMQVPKLEKYFSSGFWELRQPIKNYCEAVNVMTAFTGQKAVQNCFQKRYFNST